MVVISTSNAAANAAGRQDHLFGLVTDSMECEPSEGCPNCQPHIELHNLDNNYCTNNHYNRPLRLSQVMNYLQYNNTTKSSKVKFFLLFLMKHLQLPRQLQPSSLHVYGILHP